MKKLIFAAALASILVTGAFAGTGNGTTTTTKTVTVKVENFYNISAFANNFCFDVKDGGFTAQTYASMGGPQMITATANVGFTLTASVSIATYTVYSAIGTTSGGATSFLSTATQAGSATNSNGVCYWFDVQLENPAAAGVNSGLAPDAGTNGTLTVTIGSAI